MLPNNKKRSKIARILLLISGGVCVAGLSNYLYAQSPANEAAQDPQAMFDQMRNNFNQQSQTMRDDYDEFQEKIRAEYAAHCEKVRGMWGDAEAVESQPKQWVEYNDDLSQRSIVDFESGEVKVEILVDADQASNQAAIAQQLQQAVEQLISSRGKSTNFKSEYEQQIEVSPTPVVESLLDVEKFGIAVNDYTAAAPQGVAPTVSSNSAPMPTVSSNSVLPQQAATATPAPTPTVFSSATAAPAPVKTTIAPVKEVTKKEAAKVIVEESKYKVESRESSDGEKKTVVTINLELNKDHVNRQASKYSSTISQNAKRFSIEESLVYSIMEQESAFNPMAKSHIPAYGLMQLVPASGGRDSYNYVYKKDIKPESSYLYEPDNNIELGTAYLRLVKDRYFSKVENEKSQMLCMIASYNAGAGGVSRAINGTTNIFKAIPTINEMSYDDLYSMLKKNLPAETQDYIYKVTRNYNKYTSK